MATLYERVLSPEIYNGTTLNASGLSLASMLLTRKRRGEANYRVVLEESSGIFVDRGVSDFLGKYPFLFAQRQ